MLRCNYCKSCKYMTAEPPHYDSFMSCYSSDSFLLYLILNTIVVGKN